MAKKTATYKKERFIKILDRVAVISGVVTLVVGVVRKLVNTKNKIK